MGVGKKLVSLAAPPPNKEARFPIEELLARGGVEDAKYGASGVCQEPAAACFLTGRSDCSIESLEFGEMLVCGIQRPQVGVALTDCESSPRNDKMSCVCFLPDLAC